jgi:RHS repeat-associated protein
VIAEVGGSVQYDHTDGLGSPVALTGATGSLISRTRYEPYGVTAAGPTPAIGFTGHVSAADLGLVYMQQRYYDPVAGRFLSVDPVVTDANTGSSFNRYVYAANDPYRYVDPDGRQARGIDISCIHSCESYGSLTYGSNSSDAARVSTAQYSFETMGKVLEKGLEYYQIALAFAGPEIAAAERITASATIAGVSAKIAADAAQAGGRINGAAAELRIGKKIFTDVSTGGVPRANNPLVQSGLDKIPAAQRSLFHGGCAEVGCLNQAINSGVNPAGGASQAVRIRAEWKAAHGSLMEPCSSCQALLDYFGVKY